MAKSPGITASEVTFLEIGPTVQEISGEGTVAFCIGHQPYQVVTRPGSKRRVVFANHSGVGEMSGNRPLIISSPAGITVGQGTVVLKFENAPVEWAPRGAGRSLRDKGIDEQLWISSKGEAATLRMGNTEISIESNTERDDTVPITLAGRNGSRSGLMDLKIRNHGTIRAVAHSQQLLFPHTPRTKQVASQLADSKRNRVERSETGRTVIVHEKYDVIGISEAGGEA